MDYKDVWISSRSHLKQFVAIYNSTPKFRRAISAYNLPKGYPHVSFYFGLLRAPVIHNSLGNLYISDKLIEFKGQHSGNGKFVELKIDNIANIEIDRYLFVSPVNSAFKTNWVEIKTKGANEGLLISKAMTGFNFNYKNKTEAIYKDLCSLIS